MTASHSDVSDWWAMPIIDMVLKSAQAVVEHAPAPRKDKPIPMNMDGANATIYAELGFEPPLARGLFSLSRVVGILSHTWEQTNQRGRNKGPTPPGDHWTYEGKTPIKP